MAKLKHTPDTLDAAIRSTHEHRKKLIGMGLIDHLGKAVQPQASAVAPEPITHRGHCLKCKTKRDAITEKVEPTKNGAHHVSGKCTVCGTSLHTFMNKEDGQKLKDAMQSNMATTGGTA